MKVFEVTLETVASKGLTSLTLIYGKRKQNKSELTMLPLSIIGIPKGTWKVMDAKLNILSYTICKGKTKRREGPGRGGKGKKKGKFWNKRNLNTKNHLEHDQIWNPVVRSSQLSFKTIARSNVESPHGRMYGPLCQAPHRT